MEKGGRGVPLAAPRHYKEGSNLALGRDSQKWLIPMCAGAEAVVIPPRGYTLGGVATERVVGYGAALRAT